MINFILITLLLTTFIHYITKTPYTTLNCGIWGHFAKDSSKMDWDKFNILGIFNDERGGDAAGMIYGDNFEHCNGKNKKYINLASDTIFLEIEEDITCVFGHTRKASFGKNTGNEYTQPLFKVKEGDQYISHMFSHNGTLYNHDDLINSLELPKKFEYSNSGDMYKLNDSCTIFEALIQKKYEVLTEYNGGAAFSFYDKDEDTLYLWAGSSQNYNGVVQNERPLYVAECGDHIWFSSLKQPLEIIDTEDAAFIYHLEANILYSFKNGKFLSKVSFDRSNASQSDDSRYAGYDDYYSKAAYSGNSYQNKNSFQSKALPVATPKIDFKGLPFGNSLLDKQIIDSNEYDYNPEFYRGRYWYKGKLINGIKHLTKYGGIHDKPQFDKDKIWSSKYYFFHGIMIVDHDSYNDLVRLYPKSSFGQAVEADIKIAAEYSIYPVNVIGKDITYYYTDKSGLMLFSGSYRPLYADHRFAFFKGSCTSIVHVTGGPLYPHDKDADSSIVFTFKKEVINDLPFDNPLDDVEEETDFSFTQDTEDMNEAMFKKEVDEELASVLQAVNCSKSVLEYNAGNKLVEDGLVLLTDIEDKLSSYGNLPY